MLSLDGFKIASLGSKLFEAENSQSQAEPDTTENVPLCRSSNLLLICTQCLAPTKQSMHPLTKPLASSALVSTAASGACAGEAAASNLNAEARRPRPSPAVSPPPRAPPHSRPEILHDKGRVLKPAAVTFSATTSLHEQDHITKQRRGIECR